MGQKGKVKLIQFSKAHTAYACKLLVGLIAQTADSEETECLVTDLSLVLAVMRACFEAAPDIPSLPPEAAEKSGTGYKSAQMVDRLG